MYNWEGYEPIVKESERDVSQKTLLAKGTKMTMIGMITREKKCKSPD